MSNRFIVTNNSSLCGGFSFHFKTMEHSWALKKQQKRTVVWTDCCLFVGQRPDDLRSALHGVFSWLCLLERVIVPVLSVPSFTSCISVFHQAAITGYSYTGQALLSQRCLVLSGNIWKTQANKPMDMQSVYALLCKQCIETGKKHCRSHANMDLDCWTWANVG